MNATDRPHSFPELPRRDFLRFSALAALTGVASGSPSGVFAAPAETPLPVGPAPVPLNPDWFPSRMHAFIWRNWHLVHPDRLAEVLGARPAQVRQIASSLGLTTGRSLAPDLQKRAHLTLIRRNWHLLPYDQLLQLLGWTASELAYTLREDDFFFEKLGRLKPGAERLRWVTPDAAQQARAEEIRQLLRQTFKDAPLEGVDPLFSFVGRLSKPVAHQAPVTTPDPAGLRLGYSYFALYGDPLLDAELDPYPEGYLARLGATGVNAVWLQGVLSRLASIPWAPEDRIEKRRAGLRRLVARAARHGIQVYLYLNEPRALASNSAVFQAHPSWRGVAESGFHSVCTSDPEVLRALRGGVADLCRAVPGLGGFFTITASENLTNCWSHGQGKACPRCALRRPAEVIAEVNGAFFQGIRDASGSQRLLAWDWGWADDWALEVIDRLPKGVSLMSVSEWALPIERGGVRSTLGEYCLSAIGPGPRATRHWAAARERGLSVVAKLQLGVSWEFAAAPYLPVIENVVNHLAGVGKLGVRDLMLGWTLGGHPSPNLEAVREVAGGGTLETLARRRHGPDHATAVASFWRECSMAYREFPFSGGTVYLAPLQTGPANPLWSAPTGYHASMVGIPYDDLEGWRSIYPADIFASQLEKVASGFEAALGRFRTAAPNPSGTLIEDARFVEAASIHFASVAHQTRHILARRARDLAAQRREIEAEKTLAVRLHRLQSQDARLGFEASNQYFYTPLDLVEKVINCDWLSRRMGRA